MNARTPGLAIHWTRFHRRTAELARHLNARALFVDPPAPSRGKVWLPVRYIRAAARTRRALRECTPEFVLAALPPNFLVPTVEAYRRRYAPHLKVLYDAHTGALLSDKWRWSAPWIRRAAGRPGVGVIVTQQGLVDAVGGGDSAFVLPDAFPRVPEGIVVDTGEADGPVVVVCGHASDEPLEALMRAAHAVVDRRFVITGRMSDDRRRRLGEIPANVDLPGFLDESDYWRTLAGAALVVVLTTRPMTLVCGAYEALAVGVPLVLSDQPGLRDWFGESAEYTASDASSIAGAIRRALEARELRQAAIADLVRSRRERWQALFGDVRAFVERDAA